MTRMADTYAKLRKWFPEASDYFLFARIAVWSLILPLLLRFLSLPRLMRVLTPATPVSGFSPDLHPAAERINVYVIKIMSLNANNLGRMCLKRSLVIYRFLRLRRIPARFYVGVRKEGDRLIGHSWIEIEGRHFYDTQDGILYAVTFCCPPEAERE